MTSDEQGNHVPYEYEYQHTNGARRSINVTLSLRATYVVTQWRKCNTRRMLFHTITSAIDEFLSKQNFGCKLPIGIQLGLRGRLKFYNSPQELITSASASLSVVFMNVHYGYYVGLSTDITFIIMHLEAESRWKELARLKMVTFALLLAGNR